jgi:hypothetical protein
VTDSSGMSASDRLIVGAGDRWGVDGWAYSSSATSSRCRTWIAVCLDHSMRSQDVAAGGLTEPGFRRRAPGSPRAAARPVPLVVADEDTDLLPRAVRPSTPGRRSAVGGRPDKARVCASDPINPLSHRSHNLCGRGDAGGPFWRTAVNVPAAQAHCRWSVGSAHFAGSQGVRGSNPLSSTDVTSGNNESGRSSGLLVGTLVGPAVLLLPHGPADSGATCAPAR